MAYKTLNETCTFQWFDRVKTDFNLLDVLQMDNVTAINTWIKWNIHICISMGNRWTRTRVLWGTLFWEATAATTTKDGKIHQNQQSQRRRKK